jgi:hypothetical protein
MHENDNAPTRAGGYHRLGHIGDAEVGVQHSLRGQSILIRQGDAGHGSDFGRCLAGLLGIAAPEIVEREGVPFVRIPHTDQVDDLLKQVVEALISVRYAHPTLVQLHLELEPCEVPEPSR